jgi:predicted nucleotidyltransferase
MIALKNIPKPLMKKGLGEKLTQICKGNDVVFLAIFGSYARKKQTKRSDIDLAIRFRQGAEKSLFDIVELEDRFKTLFGRKVDLGELDSISRYIIDYVKKEMKVIYEE